MNTVTDALRPAARKLTVARTLRACLIVLAIAAAAWALIVLLAGASTVAALAVTSLAIAGLVVAAAFSRARVLDAARFVEHRSGWRERLSTSVELEAQNADNHFYERLRDEVETLTAKDAPSAFIPWHLLRPLVAAGVALLVAAVLTLALPGGLPGVWSRRADDVRRAAAERILSDEVNRLTEAAARSASVNALRLHLVGVLDRVRRGGGPAPVPVPAAGGLADVRQKARDVSAQLSADAALRPAADAVRDLDVDALRREAEALGAKVPGMSEAERAGAADAMASAADASDLPGAAEALRQGAEAMRSGRGDSLRDAFEALAQALEAGRDDAKLAEAAKAEVRETLARVDAVLAGREDPGPGEPSGRVAFFTPPESADNGTARAGNLAVAGEPPEVEKVIEASVPSDAAPANVADVIARGRAEAASPDLTPDQRKYVKRYFAPDAKDDGD